MPKRYRDPSPAQTLLLPPSLHDWLSEGHLANFVADVVSQLDIDAIESKIQAKDARGERPYSPRMMVALLFYAYASGVFSSRRIARACVENVAFRVVSANSQPHFTVIAAFRRNYLVQLEALFLQVLRLCIEAGLVKGDHVHVDGTKVQASASKHKAMSYGRMRQEDQRLRDEIAALLAKADVVDAAEDAEHGPDVRGDELPAELQRREERLATIAAAKARLEARQADEDRQKGRTPDDGRKGRGTTPFARDFGVPPDDAQDNFTDPESRIMKTSAGYDQCYNGQIAVDEVSQMIVATGLTNCAADNAELLPLIEQTHATLGEHPTEVLADAGYRGDATFRTLETRQITAYISLGREGKPGTTPNPAHEATQRMAARLGSDRGRARYRRRKAIVEPVIGWIKAVLGFRRFSVRGEAKARGEWNVVCLAVNLKRFHRLTMA